MSSSPYPLDLNELVFPKQMVNDMRVEAGMKPINKTGESDV